MYPLLTIMFKLAQLISDEIFKHACVKISGKILNRYLLFSMIQRRLKKWTDHSNTQVICNKMTWCGGPHSIKACNLALTVLSKIKFQNNSEPFIKK